jgi:hypothetical protein
LYEELRSDGFVVLTIALDRCADDPRPFIEGAGATHPSLIDSDHRFAELYHVTNVPTIFWIDEQGRICRPHDSQFGTDTFTAFHKKRSGPYLDMIRAWVRTGEGALSPEEARRLQPTISEESQLARAERALAWHLHQRGDEAAAARHFERAGALAPLDWTIRRGSMPIQGRNPFGPEFFALAEEGKPEYALEALTPTHDPEA